MVAGKHVQSSRSADHILCYSTCFYSFCTPCKLWYTHSGPFFSRAATYRVEQACFPNPTQPPHRLVHPKILRPRLPNRTRRMVFIKATGFFQLYESMMNPQSLLRRSHQTTSHHRQRHRTHQPMLLPPARLKARSYTQNPKARRASRAKTAGG
jgi:hypothetical protein